ncbi:ferrous iron transport protein A [Microlunatus elymi]|uniref:Ferrous iron transport protein A n=1 Tax=Microlunatus elymi TaxID=2596828 RepID=A0A516Q4P9_9ACTN|nr:FeoA family protein [Microlunatus elymi]QDP98417.1 ferrous iron transport protein A [Microlunatus elymi]
MSLAFLGSRVRRDATPRDDPAAVGSLAELPPGTTRRITGYADDLDTLTARRLRDLGFAPGGDVSVLRRAPLGDPVVYRVADTEIALRRAQTAHILVRPIPSAESAE